MMNRFRFQLRKHRDKRFQCQCFGCLEARFHLKRYAEELQQRRAERLQRIKAFFMRFQVA